MSFKILVKDLASLWKTRRPFSIQAPERKDGARMAECGELFSERQLRRRSATWPGRTHALLVCVCND